MRIALLSVLAVALALGACAPKSPMSVSEFRFQCRFGEEKKSGCLGGSGCGAYESVVTASYPSAQACMDDCQAAYQQTLLTTCKSRLNKGRTLCQRFCRTNFPGE